MPKLTHFNESGEAHMVDISDKDISARRAVVKGSISMKAETLALISLRQIIRELESTQQPLWSPMIMNGGGFGLFANHSLVMASYISRANAAVIDLRNLMEQG